MILLKLYFLLSFLIISNGNKEINTRKKHHRRKISEIHQIINKIYDRNYPDLNISENSVKKIDRHLRCVVDRPMQAAEEYISDLYRNVSRNHEVFVHAPCLWLYRLGNMLSQYFEGLACAHVTGLHYITVAKIWNHEIEKSNKVHPFLDHLPSYIEHPDPNSREVIIPLLKPLCTCQYRCHELPNAIWPKRLHLIKSIMHDALSHHIAETKYAEQGTKVAKGELSNAPVDTILPLIPVLINIKDIFVI